MGAATITATCSADQADLIRASSNFFGLWHCRAALSPPPWSTGPQVHGDTGNPRSKCARSSNNRAHAVSAAVRPGPAVAEPVRPPRAPASNWFHKRWTCPSAMPRARRTSPSHSLRPGAARQARRRRSARSRTGSRCGRTVRSSITVGRSISIILEGPCRGRSKHVGLAVQCRDKAVYAVFLQDCSEL